ncbi:MAG: hypothetical protein K6T30_10185 [Alicyclobacillus sp.]|nr:hypothetical protein [Alicyclobacillus sp.]
MSDYRDNPQQSPLVWCPKCKRLVQADRAGTVMKTAFHVEQAGIFPFGLCAEHLPVSAPYTADSVAPETEEQRLAHIQIA